MATVAVQTRSESAEIADWQGPPGSECTSPQRVMRALVSRGQTWLWGEAVRVHKLSMGQESVSERCRERRRGGRGGRRGSGAQDAVAPKWVRGAVSER